MKIKKFVLKHKISISLVLFIIALSIFMMLFSGSDSDYYWHIKAGKYMIENKEILTKDIFSWYMVGKPWFSHEWLFEIIIAMMASIFPNKHIFIFVLSNLLFINLFILFSNKKNYQKNIVFSLLWITFSLILTTTLRARPYMISNIFLAMIIYFLYDLIKNEKSRKIYFIPLIALLWSNIHGGSSNLIYIVLFIFLITGQFKFNFTKVESKKNTALQTKKIILVILLSIIAISINPQGINMLFYPYQNIADTFMQQTISEWQPTTLSSLSHYPYFVLAIIIIIAMLLSKKKINLLDLTLFAFFLFLGLKSIRFWSYTYIASSYFVFNYISERKEDKATVPLITLLSIFLVLIYFNTYSKLNANQAYLSDTVIKIIKSENPKRIYNSYDYGGYLIYKDIDVFIDGRADLYSKYNYKDYYVISNFEEYAEKLIEKYNFDYFLVKKEYPIATYLKTNSSYQEIYNDKKAILYKKNTE